MATTPTFDWSQVNFAGQAINPYNVQPQQATSLLNQNNSPVTPNTSINFPTSPSASTGGGTGSTYTTQPVWPSSQPPRNQPGTQATGGGTTGFTWNVPQWMRGLTPQQWATPEMQQAVQNYMAGSLPFTQLQQNAYQYAQDYNEAQRRWDQQFGWTQQNDQFNQNLANQQQQLALQVANQQQANWAQQFNLDNELGKRGMSNQEAQTRIDEMWKAGQLNNTAQDLRQQDWYNRQQVGIAQQQNTIDQMWKSGQLTNQQRELALAELTQKQLDTYRTAQLTQEAALARENYANQANIARMNAFGRTQTPRARWVRSWA